MNWKILKLIIDKLKMQNFKTEDIKIHLTHAKTKTENCTCFHSFLNFVFGEVESTYELFI